MTPLTDWADPLVEIKARLADLERQVAALKMWAEQFDKLLGIQEERERAGSNLPQHRRWHPRHLSGFSNMTTKAQAEHLRGEHDYRADGLDADGRGRVHGRLHADPRRQKARTP